MKKQNTYSFESIRKYLQENHYVKTYRQGTKDAYHHYKTNEHVLVPYEKGSYTEVALLQLFQNSKGTELPAEIEICRFKLYTHQQLNN
jgi:hypothetical protein